MDLPSYPQYKRSRVEWLGDVPSHWTVVSIKWLSPVQRGASPRPIDDPKYFDDDGEYAWVRIADVSASDDGRLRETTQRLSELGSSLSVKIQPGEIFVSIAGTVGKPCISEINACIHDGFVYFPHIEINRRFLFRIFEAGICYGGLGKWGTQLNLNTDTVGAIRIPVPSDDELDGIVKFLDAETSKIDALVAEQRRLIALLKEKRQAVISHAVTKGLNPDVRMKPSGIEWLGDVPEHWDVVRLRRCGRVQNGLNIGGEAFGSGNPFVSYGDVYNHPNVPEMPSGLVQSTFEDQEKCSLEAGDVLFTRTSETVDDIGIASTCLCAIPLATFAGFLIRLRPKEDILHPAYSTYLFRNQGVQRHFAGTMNLVTRASLSQDMLKDLPICIPPLEEQQEIAEFINKKLELFGGLMDEAERAIELLQERRTALISAAVTGKIDVREFACQETA